MSARRCQDCRRLYATGADWQASVNGPDCPEAADCPWGGDRCWHQTGHCGYLPDSVADLAAAGRELRAGRTLTRTPHPHTAPEGTR